MHQICSRLDRFSNVAPTVVRVIIGLLFVWHGIDKFDAGIDMVEGMFTQWGVPAPGASAFLVAVVELVGGAALIAGLLTRATAMLLTVVMVGAIYYVKADLGLISSVPMPGAELDLALIAGLVSLVLTGPGRFAVDDLLRIERHDACELPTPAPAPVSTRV